MGIAATAAEVFRLYEIDGVPSSGAHKPGKAAIQALFGDIEAAVGGSSGDPSENYLRDLSGVLSGTAVAIPALTTAIAAHEGEPIILPAADLTASTKGLVLAAAGGVQKTHLKGQGSDLTRLTFSGAYGNCMVATGDGPVSWKTVTADIVKGRRQIAVGGGADLTGFTARKHLAIQSTEYGPAQVADQAKFTWAATTAIAKGALTWANGNWYVCTTAGTTGSTAPTGTGTAVTDGSATLCCIPTYGAAAEQRLRANSTAYTVGNIRVSAAGYILVCHTAGTSNSTPPSISYSNSLTNVTDGTVVWRLAGYYNSTKGELKLYGIVGAAAGVVTTAEPIEDDYPLSYTGVTFTVQVSVVDMAEVWLEGMTIEGSGAPAAGSMTAVGSGTAIYYLAGSSLDIGLLAKWCIVVCKDVVWDKVEQNCVEAGNCASFFSNVKYLFGSLKIDSQQYGYFLHGAGFLVSDQEFSQGARHNVDADGSASISDRSLRGIASAIMLSDSKAQACWQSVCGNHRVGRNLVVIGGDWTVDTAGFKARCASWVAIGLYIRGPRYALDTDYLAYEGLFTGYYQAGKGLARGIRLEGGYYGVRISDADGTEGDWDIEAAAEGAWAYNARIGTAKSDVMDNVRLVLNSKNPVTYDHVLIDGTLTNADIDLTYKGGRGGLVNNNVKPTFQGRIAVRGDGCSASPVEMYNWSGGRLDVGGIKSSYNGSQVYLKDVKHLTIAAGGPTLPSGFSASAIKIEATSAGLSDDIMVESQSPWGASNTGTAVEIGSGVTNCRVKPVGGNCPTKLTAADEVTNVYHDKMYMPVAASRSLAVQDDGKTLAHTSGSAHALTIDPVATTKYPVGFKTRLTNPGAGVWTITKGAGVTLKKSGAVTSQNWAAAQYGFADLTHESSDVWVLSASIGLT